MRDYLKAQYQVARDKANSLQDLAPYGLQRTQAGYYYIAHYYPLRAMEPVTPEESRNLLAPLAGAKFETYLHFPFCEIKCSFCHFHKNLVQSGFGTRQEELLRALEAEMRLYTTILGKIPARSFYIGGGTPSLMSNETLAKLLKLVRKYLDIEPSAELKFELFPKRYPQPEIDEKLRILKGFGFTDIVIDLESGNPESLKRVGRHISSLEAYLDLVDLCISHGFSSIVTGLIIGMPHETYETLGKTVLTLLGIPEVTVINTFPLITRPPDPIYHQLQKRPDIFHDAESRDALWIFIRNLFREQGFTEGPISYLHRPEKQPRQQYDKFECVNLLGFGPSGFGYLNGSDWAAQYFNLCNTADYYQRLNRGEIPIWRAGILDQEERARRKLIFGLANCKPESLVEIERRFGVSVNELVGQELNALHTLGLIDIEPHSGSISYTEKGLCRLEEISYFLGSDFVKNRCAEPVSESERKVELLSHHYYIDIKEADRLKFEKFARDHPSDFMYELYRSATAA